MADTKSLFGKKPVGANSIDNSSRDNLNRRIRVLEERFQNLQKKQEVTEENMLDTNKEHESELKLLNQEMADLKDQFIAMKDKIQDMVQEISSKAPDSEFMVFKKYLELWRPVNFVSERGVERIVDEKLKRLTKKK